MRKFCLIFSTILVVIFHLDTFGQVNFLTTTVPINISAVLDLGITTNTANTINFNTTTAINNGITLLNATILTYKSNQAYYITINSQTANFTGGATPAMPASVVQYRLNGGSTYVGLSATAAPLVASSGTKAGRGTGTYGLDFFINPGYAYPPAANYLITIVYTISNQ
jgi:spore coat protein U-like protein